MGVIDIYHLTFRYRRKGPAAVQDASARIESGIYLLAGENGAGKTTLLQIMCGLRKPQSGRVLLDGCPATCMHPSVMQRIFMLEENQVFPCRTIWEFAKANSRFYPTFNIDAFVANLQDFGQSGYEPMAAMSLGTRKKAQLAYALALGVEVLLLDEPTNGLDIQSKEMLRRIIARSCGEDQTIIVSTHTVAELENLFSGMLMIHHGHLILSATCDEIAERLYFGSGRTAPISAIYIEQRLNGFNYLAPNTAGDFTKVDLRLLYLAMSSDASDTIQQLFQPSNTYSND